MSYCGWTAASVEDRLYHDTEWGVPFDDDRRQFECLTLEVMQCGLSWKTVLQKREILRRCFAGFDYEKIAAFDDAAVAQIAKTDGMIRSERKIRAVIGNACCFKAVRREFGSFTAYLQTFCGRQPIVYTGHDQGQIPVSNGLSARIAKDLHRRGFKYTGAIVIYSHLQACGMINDHDALCPCRQKIIKDFPPVELPPDEEVF